MESFLGEVTLFAGDFAPRGWVRCDGQLLPIGQNQALFAILSNRFGGSQAQGTFALPTISPATKGVHYIVCVAGMFPTR